MEHFRIEELSQLENFITIRDQNENHEVENEREALQKFLRIWAKAPLEWKVKCQPPSRDTVRKTLRDRIGVESWSKDTITVSKNITTQLQLWNNEPLSFFTTGIRISVDFLKDPFSRLYSILDQIEGEATAIQEIRLRIAKIGLHSLRGSLECCQLRSETEIDNEFARRVQAKGNPVEVRKRLRKWATMGRKYASLSEELGGLGSIICIPMDISKTRVERIPPSGDIRIRAIENLRGRGINDKAKADIKFCYDVAEKIWKAIQADVDSYFLHYELPLHNLNSIIYARAPKRKQRSTEECHNFKRKYCSFNPALGEQRWNNEVFDGLAHITSRQCEVDNTAGQNQGMPDIVLSSRPGATTAHELETGNQGIHTITAVQPPATSPHQQVQEFGLSPCQEAAQAFWNDMTSVPQYPDSWIDVTSVAPYPDFWNEMTPVPQDLDLWNNI